MRPNSCNLNLYEDGGMTVGLALSVALWSDGLNDKEASTRPHHSQGIFLYGSGL